MNEVWMEAKLGDIITLLTDYHANGSYKNLKQNVTLLDEPNYAVMIRTKNFEQNDFTNDLKYIEEPAYNFLKKSKVYPGDILMNKIANAGSVYFMPDLQRPVSLAMNLFLIRIDPEEANQKYIYYYLKVNEAYVKSFANGAATNTITKENVRNLDTFLPRKSIQNKIVSIMSSFDDLIENNTRRIQILEEMAQCIYREWFVHFRYPGHENDNLIDSGTELGMIPEGWSLGTIDDIAVRIKHRYVESEHKHLSLLDLAKIPRETNAITEIGHSGELKTARTIFESGDTLFGSIRPYFHKVCLAPFKGITNISVFTLRSKKQNYSAFINSVLFSKNTVAWATQHSGGTKMPVIKWDLLKMMPVPIPNETIAKGYQNLVIPKLNLIKNMVNQNIILRDIRDLLLPKLISGQIDVSDLDIDIGDLS